MRRMQILNSVNLNQNGSMRFNITNVISIYIITCIKIQTLTMSETTIMIRHRDEPSERKGRIDKINICHFFEFGSKACYARLQPL